MNSYVDLQVNGYAGVDFNDDSLTEAAFVAACTAMRDDGVALFLPTIITDTIPVMVRRIKRLSELIDSHPDQASIVGGIHVEGPFISPVAGFVGAHPADCACDATVDQAMQLVDAGQGKVQLFTLAPEMNGTVEVIRRLRDESIVVAGGHSDATVTQLRAAIDGGLSMFTHLGNGCPGQMHRHDNIVQRVLSLAEDLVISFIADGHHVPWFALGNYLKRVPDPNIVIVTDAISAAGLGPGFHRLAGQMVEVDQHLAAWAEGHEHFAGCATTMPQMAELLADRLGIDAERIDRWTRINPARVLEKANR